MNAEQVVLTAVVGGGVLAFLIGFFRAVLAIRKGTPEKWWDQLGRRIKNVVVYGILQRKIFRERTSVTFLTALAVRLRR